MRLNINFATAYHNRSSGQNRDSHCVIAPAGPHALVTTQSRAMHSHIRPNTHIALRLPSGLLKIIEITPNTYVA